MFNILNTRQIIHRIALITFVSLTLFCSNVDAGVIKVSYDELSRNGLVDFEDLNVHVSQPMHLEGTFRSGLAQFGEKFEGQSLSYEQQYFYPGSNNSNNTHSDILGNTASAPLSLSPGSSGANVTIVNGADGNEQNIAIAGSGKAKHPSPHALGEGSIAILFDYDQSEFGFDLLGGQLGSAILQFWDRQGTLLDVLELEFNNKLGEIKSLGFKTDDNSYSIAGVSIFNTDLGGIGFDNFVFDVINQASAPDTNTPPDSSEKPGSVIAVSEPPMAAFSLFLFTLMALRRKFI